MCEVLASSAKLWNMWRVSNVTSVLLGSGCRWQEATPSHRRLLQLEWNQTFHQVIKKYCRLKSDHSSFGLLSLTLSSQIRNCTATLHSLLFVECFAATLQSLLQWWTTSQVTAAVLHSMLARKSTKATLTLTHRASPDPKRKRQVRTIQKIRKRHKKWDANNLKSMSPGSKAQQAHLRSAVVVDILGQSLPRWFAMSAAGTNAGITFAGAVHNGHQTMKIGQVGAPVHAMENTVQGH